MELLVTELNVLLKLLDHETLSCATEEKKTAVKNLLGQLQPSGKYRKSLSDIIVCHIFLDQSTADSPPPLPNTPPPEDYYEEAVPLSPGKMPEYITSRSSSSPPNSIEDGYYEDAENNYPTTQVNRQRKNSYNDSDALSSSYESYDEEEEEKGQRLTHQWPSEENSMAPVRDCHICAFLLRKKRFGQWAKQLTVIRENRLQCYKSSKDQSPYTDIPLSLCTVIYVPKDGRRKKHELRFSLPGGEALVLAVQSKEQAEKWLQVVRDVTGQGNGLDSPSSPMIPRKIELDKLVRKIIPPVTLLLNQCWKEHWCRVQAGSLYLYHEKGEQRVPHTTVALKGCEVVPGLGPKHPFALRILKGGAELAALEENERLMGGAQTKRRSSFSSSDTGKPSPQITLKRHGSNANQYGRYGKTRAQEDARQYLKEKEDLEKEIDSIRSALVSLRKKKREAKEKMKGAPDKQKLALEERVAQLEDSCRVKEGERVDLELKLTQVKENVKKSLAGGELGAPTESKTTNKTQRMETQYIESFLPVNCTSEMRKRPPSIYASAKGNVMQKAKEWESKKGT
ncbi:actin filament-associated protein 1-like 1 [Sinocyclocheilus grahami]|uniref:actin filament-associated protein 1-like 1 n=1 Tax=Sinocyclocheilus grahami TaxID=75366 RepID=UPI0007AC799D|nr:PREDICTED: actin filament-associated protein 1-like 1 [Sinocyclocheilus grahami]